MSFRIEAHIAQVVDATHEHVLLAEQIGFGLLGEGLRAEGIVINDPMCCKKTFEHYFDVLDEVIEKMQM